MEKTQAFTRVELETALKAGQADEAFTGFCLDSYDDNRALEIESETPEEFVSICREVYKDHDWAVPANG